MRSDEGLLLLSGDGTILWANPSAGTLLGYSPSELVQMGLPLIDAASGRPFSSPGPVADAFRSVLAGTVSNAEGDARFPDKDGKRVAVHWKLWMLPSTPPQKRILLALSETAQAAADGPVTAGYREVFEYAVEGIFRSTLEGRFLEVNPALAKLYGYRSPAEFMAAKWDINTQLYVQPNRRAEFLRLMHEEGVATGFESEVRKANGSTFWIAEFARTVRDKNHVPIYFEGSVIDITERQAANAALKRSEERFRRLVETTHVIPFEFDAQSQVFLYLGPQMEALVGHRLSHGCPLDAWAAILHPEDFDLGTAFARESGRRSTRDFQSDFRVLGADGRVMWVRQIVNCASDDDETEQCVRGFFFDVTPAKREEEEREHSRLQFRELAARSQQVRENERMKIAREIHDELGQALTLLKIDLAWFANHSLTAVSDDLRKPLQEKLEKMDQMIRGTLQAVRRILSALRPPLLDELGLKEAIEFHMGEFSKRAGIRYEFNAGPVSSLSVDSVNAVFRIFQESLTNVARHARASRLKVSLQEANLQVVLRVEDNGCGISQDQMNHSKHFGLLGMRERAWAVGGELEIVGLPGAGTAVTLRVPVHLNGASPANSAA